MKYLFIFRLDGLGLCGRAVILSSSVVSLDRLLRRSGLLAHRGGSLIWIFRRNLDTEKRLKTVTEDTADQMD